MDMDAKRLSLSLDWGSAIPVPANWHNTGIWANSGREMEL